MTTVVVFTCAHAQPNVSNERFTWLGNFLYDIRPDMVIDLGDGADMKSLNTYDTRYPQAIVAQNYEADIDCYNDAQERLRWKFKHHKKKRPTWIGFEGNHENRIKKAISNDPRMAGSKYGISFSHLQTDIWFDEYHEYTHSAPALVAYDGILYGHYVAGGNYGTALSGKHHAYALIENKSCSVTVGHSHKLSYHPKASAKPHPIHGLVCGCFKGEKEDWAGQANDDWTAGVAVKRYVENGNYDFQWISLKALEAEYSS